MYQGQSVFSRLMDFIPTSTFQTCVDRYQDHRYVKDFSCWDQFLCLALAQLTYRAETVYAFDSTTIDLCLRLFPWAQFRRRKSVVKLHTPLDVRGSIPTSVYVTGGQVHDVNLLDALLPEPGAFYLLDRSTDRRRYLPSFPVLGASAKLVP